MLMSHDFKAVNPYWQITETKFKNWDITRVANPLVETTKI